MSKKFTFIDLFAGIGGFHQALRSLGGTCVAASEINKEAIFTYSLNFPDTVMLGDINKVWDQLPKFDLLAGGFPCQPFSKAGKQNGFSDEKSGNLFYTIIKILKIHPECKFILLENVRNLSDKTENWDIIQKELKQLNFYVTEKPLVLSPSQFGIPQVRERVYILGIRKDIRDKSKLKNGFIHLEELSLMNLPNPLGSLKSGDAWKVLDNNVNEKYDLPSQKVQILQRWDEFRKGTNYETAGCPIWLDYMGIGKTDYEYMNDTLYQQNQKKWLTIDELPNWKKAFALKNRLFYKKHKKFIDGWSKKYKMLQQLSTYKKFEWNCGTKFTSIKDVITQFRHSGIRTKKPTYFPTLVAINNKPIIWDKSRYRYITPKEAAKLQSFDKEFIFSNNDSQSYKQLGNAVNVKIVKLLAKKLMEFAYSDWNKEEIGNGNNKKN